MTSEAEWEHIALEELGEEGWVRTAGATDRERKPAGRDVEELVAKVRELVVGLARWWALEAVAGDLDRRR